MPAALVATGLEAYLLLEEWPHASTGLKVHDVATLIWLIGNTTWMCTDLMATGVATDQGRVAALVLFALGWFVLLVYYIACLATSGGLDTTEQGRLDERRHRICGVEVSEEVLGKAFIGPWILKDFFWTCGFFWPTCASAALVAYFIIVSWRQSGGIIHLALMLWLLGNVAWVYSELWAMDKVYWPRCAAALIFIFGMGIMVFSGISIQADASREENAPLLSKHSHDLGSCKH